MLRNGEDGREEVIVSSEHVKIMQRGDTCLCWNVGEYAKRVSGEEREGRARLGRDEKQLHFLQT